MKTKTLPGMSFAAAALASLAFQAGSADGAIDPVFERDGGTDRETDGTFVFDTVPSNSSTDLASGLGFVVLDGSANANSGPISYLTDGPAQTNWDSCCGTEGETWFASDTGNTRIQVDLGASVAIGEINTFSWHRNARAPQIYKVYGAVSPSNSAPDFTAAAFQDDTALAGIGYTLIGTVDTGAYGQGGQVGVSFAGEVGSFRYVLFDLVPPPGGGGFRATFFGEIDIVAPVITPPFMLTITPNASTPGNYDFEWESEDGRFYDLVSNTDLLTPPVDWQVYDPDGPKGPYQDIPSAGSTTGEPDVPGGDDTRRFFAVIEKDPPLLNASFEDPAMADGQFTSVAPPGWTEFDEFNLGEIGVWNPLGSEHATVPDPEPPEAGQVAQVYHVGIVPMTAFGFSQVLGANFAENTDYRVTVEAGRSTYFAWPGYRVELWAGATRIAEESSAAVPAPDSWTTSTVSYSYDAGDAGLAGEPLEIRLLSLGEDPEGAGSGVEFSVEFDDVTFTATGP
jgi:hypothetical protein